jgi:hypothetical protein|tara:strand:+ start:4205 stop:4348 length:144 start_codon:yes stop_codon:yes gene_type:complete
MAKNSAPRRTNKPAELKKANIRNKTEWTGFRADITMTAEKIVMNEKR